MRGLPQPHDFVCDRIKSTDGGLCVAYRESGPFEGYSRDADDVEHILGNGVQHVSREAML
jgi:hypothetical protein